MGFSLQCRISMLKCSRHEAFNYLYEEDKNDPLVVAVVDHLFSWLKKYEKTLHFIANKNKNESMCHQEVPRW
jgi:hypothetical protein